MWDTSFYGRRNSRGVASIGHGTNLISCYLYIDDFLKMEHSYASFISHVIFTCFHVTTATVRIVVPLTVIFLQMMDHIYDGAVGGYCLAT